MPLLFLSVHNWRGLCALVSPMSASMPANKVLSNCCAEISTHQDKRQAVLTTAHPIKTPDRYKVAWNLQYRINVITRCSEVARGGADSQNSQPSLAKPGQASPLLLQLPVPLPLPPQRTLPLSHPRSLTHLTCAAHPHPDAAVTQRRGTCHSLSVNQSPQSGFCVRGVARCCPPPTCFTPYGRRTKYTRTRRRSNSTPLCSLPRVKTIESGHCLVVRPRTSCFMLQAFTRRTMPRTKPYKEPPRPPHKASFYHESR